MSNEDMGAVPQKTKVEIVNNSELKLTTITYRDERNNPVEVMVTKEVLGLHRQEDILPRVQSFIEHSLQNPRDELSVDPEKDTPYARGRRMIKGALGEFQDLEKVLGPLALKTRPLDALGAPPEDLRDQFLFMRKLALAYQKAIQTEKIPPESANVLRVCPMIAHVRYVDSAGVQRDIQLMERVVNGRRMNAITPIDFNGPKPDESYFGPFRYAKLAELIKPWGGENPNWKDITNYVARVTGISVFDIADRNVLAVTDSLINDPQNFVLIDLLRSPPVLRQ